MALKEYQKVQPDTHGVILETAHPSKFIADVESILNTKVDIPERLACLADKKKEATLMSTSFEPFKDWLQKNY